MAKHIQEQQHKQTHSRPLPSEDANKQQRQAAVKEVAGRHKNDGKKDHKATR